MTLVEDASLKNSFYTMKSIPFPYVLLKYYYFLKCIPCKIEPTTVTALTVSPRIVSGFDTSPQP